MNEVWKKLLKHLPLCAAEGSGVTEVAAGELERLIEEDSDCRWCFPCPCRIVRCL